MGISGNKERILIEMQILIIEDSPVIVETISLALEIRWPDVKISVTPPGNKVLR